MVHISCVPILMIIMRAFLYIINESIINYNTTHTYALMQKDNNNNDSSTLVIHSTTLTDMKKKSTKKYFQTSQSQQNKNMSTHSFVCKHTL